MGRTLAARKREEDDSAKNVEKSFAGRSARPDRPLGERRPVAGGLEYRLESGHPRPVENTRALSSRRDMFLDERGTGLRVSWHPERDLVVLSVWQDDRCVGTFRMSVQDIPRLSGLLAAALSDWVDQTGPLAATSGRGAGGPGTGGSRTAGPGTGGPEAVGLGTSGPGAGGDQGLSVPQRLRLSRPVLKLRGFQHRRRRLG
jgi:hypothetical protein